MDLSVLSELIRSRIDMRGPDECWPWTGSVHQGYGYAKRLDGQGHEPAHRVVYRAMVGPISDGLTIDHLCHNRDEACRGGETCPHRRCMNPTHLEQCTAVENAKRSPSAIYNVMARMTHCKRGHEFTDENTYRNRGRRVCKTCQREHSARYKDAHRPPTREPITGHGDKPGTRTGYQRHRSQGETPCDDCRLAHNESIRDFKRARRASETVQ